MPSISEILDQQSTRQGWSEDTERQLLSDFLDEADAVDPELAVKFTRFLADRARAENAFRFDPAAAPIDFLLDPEIGITQSPELQATGAALANKDEDGTAIRIWATELLYGTLPGLDPLALADLKHYLPRYKFDEIDWTDVRDRI